MTWRVDNVDLRVFIVYGSVFRQDGNAALPLDVIGVHDAFFYFLILAEYAALF